jgi:hypothetical protein
LRQYLFVGLRCCTLHKENFDWLTILVEQL